LNAGPKKRRSLNEKRNGERSISGIAKLGSKARGQAPQGDSGTWDFRLQQAGVGSPLQGGGGLPRVRGAPPNEYSVHCIE
jgi:hypothetical protein